jgi:hypothetical protein
MDENHQVKAEYHQKDQKNVKNQVHGRRGGNVTTHQ